MCRNDHQDRGHQRKEEEDWLTSGARRSHVEEGSGGKSLEQESSFTSDPQSDGDTNLKTSYNVDVAKASAHKGFCRPPVRPPYLLILHFQLFEK